MNAEEPHDDYGKLTHQQQRFCDLYLTHFNAFKAAVESGYSENTSRKGALLHVPKIQQYLKAAMNMRSQRLEITHDMILRELSKIAFSNMGNYYDEYACLKRMNELTVDEKAAISYYDITEIQDGEGYRVGTQSRIKLHNKMSALDKIARHLNFYGSLSSKQKAESEKQESPKSESPEVRKKEDVAATVAVVDKSINNLPMDYPVEDFELEGIDLKTQRALEEVNVSPGRVLFEPEESGSSSCRGQEVLEHGENMENILTISPLPQLLNDRMIDGLNRESRVSNAEFALGMVADTGPSTGSGQAPVAKACAV